MNISRRISKWFVVGIVLAVMNGDRDFRYGEIIWESLFQEVSVIPYL